jgi:hypothetical protein
MLVVLAAIKLLLTAVAVVGGLYLFVAYAGAPSSPPRPKRLVWGAVIAPLLVTVAATQFTYSVPYRPWFVTVVVGGLVVSAVAGLVLLSMLGFRSRMARFAATAGYLVLVGAACLLVGVFTACGNGDCL